eukprot:TRINITY_DN2613_c0_g3_i1.p1 TRINITY_DN2613_c0_g3~~TRINITY_DN2613_c0_g3_i1.p1  ORF type:complete len:240 (+),score=62.88 TRINITY_DN2613_c0_g3_i1:56-775(+)
MASSQKITCCSCSTSSSSSSSSPSSSSSFSFSTTPKWLCGEPKQWTAKKTEEKNALLDGLIMTTDPKTDFWQRTHYGFQRDNGHFRYVPVSLSDFEVYMSFTGTYTSLYDQAGIMMRIDENNWMKCGVEFFDKKPHISAVVTNNGFSDWSVVTLDEKTTMPLTVSLKLVRVSAEAIELHYTLGDYKQNKTKFDMFRMCHLPGDKIMVGQISASPNEKEGFKVQFGPLTCLQNVSKVVHT